MVGAVSCPTRRFAPHCAKNFAAGKTGAWQLGHDRASGFPHSVQKRPSRAFSLPQFVQRMHPPLVALRYLPSLDRATQQAAAAAFPIKLAPRRKRA